MPKDYSFSKIYKMVSPSGLTCIGSTCEKTLAKRKDGHKNMYKFYCKGQGQYYSSFKLFEEDENNVEIFLLERFPCRNRDQLNAREGYYIKHIDCVNKYIAGRNQYQYNIDNKHIINSPNTCPCGGKFTRKNISQHSRTLKHRTFTQLPIDV